MTSENSTTPSFDFEAAYKVEGHPGIAWRATKHSSEIQECQGHPDEGETMGEAYYCDGSCEESQIDESRVICHMIGDDRDFEFEITELTKLDDEEYCGSCGQIGCGWH